jgi:hypothetical protein
VAAVEAHRSALVGRVARQLRGTDLQEEVALPVAVSPRVVVVETGVSEATALRQRAEAAGLA